jgi:arylsulfatase A-like enzyme
VTRSIDVLPTLLGLAGLPVPPPEEGRGVDLSPALRGEASPPKLRAWSHTVTIPPLVLEASEEWGLFRKLNPSVDPELMWVQVRDADRVYQLRRDLAGEVVPAVFDLASDSGELENLYTGDGEERRVVAELRRYRERLIQAYHEHVEGGEGVDEERARELLESLGYIDG